MTSASTSIDQTSVRPDFDEAFVRKALAQANMNVLRAAMLQLTGDPELAAIPSIESPIRGGALFAYTLPADSHDLVREKALAWLLQQHDVPPPPDESEARRIMEIFAGQSLTPEEVRFGYEELAFDPFPRDVQWSRKPAPDKLAAFKVVIVGGGISGIAAALQLKRLGIPHTLYERNADIGGTWYVNRYPEARVDTSSYLYQFKFEKNYPWSEYFASRDETQKYLNHIVDKYALRDVMQFNTEVVDGQWDEASSQWILTLRNADGSEETVRANVVISASGLFSKPKKPDIPGLDSFEGKVFHTTEWDYGFDLAGKRAALIGTGSTGTQLMPKIAEEAASLAIYQRSPEWVMAFENYKAKITPEIRWLFDNIPYYWNWFCFSSHLTGQTMQELQRWDRDWQKSGGRVNARNDKVRETLLDYIRTKVNGDEALVARLTPNFAPLVRRLVVDNGFYDTVMRDNVELVTGGIREITPMGIISDDGTERDFDLIILGTGFAVADYFWPVSYQGRNGAQLSDLWDKDGARSYLGITMPGFPNFFIFYGPNGSPRSGGFYSWAEIWARYICSAVVQMIEQDKSWIEVRRSVYDAYNAGMDEGMKALTWESDGAGYYVNQFGRSGIFMPWLTHEYHAMIEKVNLEDYTLG